MAASTTDSALQATPSSSNSSPALSSQHVTIPYIPQLFDENFLDQLYPNAVASKPSPPSATPSHPFTDALKEEANKTTTEKGAPAFVSTKSATLDAFSTLDNNVKGKEVHTLLRESWAEDPDSTIRIIWNLRSIHDGKASKFGFYRAFGWLYANHPKTAIANLSMLVSPVVEKKLKKKKESDGAKTDDAGSEWTAVDAGAEAEPIIPVGRSHGYYKDLLNILSLAVTGELTRPESYFPSIQAPRPLNTKNNGTAAAKRRVARKEAKANSRKQEGKEVVDKKTANEVSDRQSSESKAARLKRTEALDVANTRLVSKLEKDPNFKALYVAIARIFAKALADDAKLLREISGQDAAVAEKAGLKWKMTMAGKWAPSLGCSHDRITNLATAISLVMFSNGDFADLKKPIQVDAAVSEADVQTLRGYYRRWIVSPLRQHASIPEVKMSANEWKKINYARVSSLSFARNKTNFFKHDEDGLVKFIKDVSSGKKTISGATLLPHELVHEALLLNAQAQKGPLEKRLSETSAQIVDAQWKSLVDRMQESGSLSDCLAVVDVSGSMGALAVSPDTKKKKTQSEHVEPIFPAVALGLLLARIAKAPFQNMFITFSEEPEIVTLSSAPDIQFIDLIQDMGKANWGGTTDFNATFLELILPMAIKHKIKKEDMVKRLFVFSDMQFDEAAGGGGHWDSEKEEWVSDVSGEWQTNHETIAKAYEAAGYDVPEMVYWNLNGKAGSKPVTKDTPGVAMVSGFSGNLLKVFMEGEEIKEEGEEWNEVDEKGEEVKEVETKEKQKMTPEDIMKKALWKNSFEGLKVLD